MTIEAPVLRIDPLLDDEGTQIIVCCGSGGVGKTTTAAALGLRAAERGRKVVVLTIDPAHRLAQSMGLTELDNTPRQVAGVQEESGGRLDAMMLDMKRTFDEVVLANADPARARAILGNPFYQSLSAGFAGTQEYMAMEKLGQLRARGEWDLIVVDTPPSRSALDFLDAPKRLGSFLDGRFIKLLMAPARAGGRAGMMFLNAGMSVVTGALNKVVGAHVLRDVQTFVAAMDTMFGGFRKRADATYRLLQAPGTAFLVVAAPERDALREASYFVERLAAESMPLAGLVLNRVHGSTAARLTAERALSAAEELEDLAGPAAGEDGEPGSDAAPEPGTAGSSNGRNGGRAAGNGKAAHPGDGTAHRPAGVSVDTARNGRAAAAGRPGQDVGRDAGREHNGEVPAELLTAGLLRLHAERMQLIDRERRTRNRFAAVHPEVPVAEVAALPGDVHDLAGLREVGERMASGRPAAAE